MLSRIVHIAADGADIFACCFLFFLRVSVSFCRTILLNASCVFDLRITETDDQPGIMIFRDIQHGPGFRCQFVQDFCRIAHDRRTQAVRIAEKFKVCGGKMTVCLAVLSPFAGTLFVRNEKMRGPTRSRAFVTPCILPVSFPSSSTASSASDISGSLLSRCVVAVTRQRPSGCTRKKNSSDSVARTGRGGHALRQDLRHVFTRFSAPVL